MKRAHVLLAAAALWGCTGSAGPEATGGAGTSGAAGSSGATGNAGGAGTSGAAGTSGTAGNAGTTGVSGAAGTTGTAGTSGAAGGAGAAGTAGAAGRGGASGRGGVGGAGGRGGTAGTAAGGTTGTAGSAGSTVTASFYLGADITDQETQSVATRASLLTLMKARGFNYVRLRTFVNPKAADGYDKTNGYDDIAHTVAFGKQVKDAGMGLLIDFHYSDNWADPGKQCVPVAWQTYTTIADLATAVHDYTKDAITQLVAGGARPDIVQIGNETTPGMLIHKCDSTGKPTGNNAITGSTSNWTNLGMLLKAGVAGVKEVDGGILISFHIDRGNAYSTSKNWIDNAVKQGAVFDAFGESCYQQYQGDTSSIANTKNGWMTTFTQLVAAYPNIKFFAAEYGPMEREINDVVFNLPNNQGIGTFDWEPTSQGSWNAKQPTDPSTTTTHALFQRSGSTYSALPDLALYDQMKVDYAGRL